MNKTILADLNMVYAVGIAKYKGRKYLLAASEKKGGAAYLIDPEKGTKEKIWDGPGGVMGMVGAEEGEFLSIDEFYPVFDSADAAVYRTVIGGEEGHHTFVKEKLFDLPWCHRLSYVHEQDGNYIVCGSLCKRKEFVEDWSTRGSVYAYAYADGKVSEPETIISEKILKHHAMWVHKNAESFDDIYVGGSEGVFRVYRENHEWKYEKIIEVPTSDIAIADLDGDGEEELAIIQGFHGNAMKVFKKNNGTYKEIGSCDFEFGHVLWAGDINGKECLLLGTRAAEKFLDMFTLTGDFSTGFKLDRERIDEGVAPAQISVFESNGNTCVAAAEHGVGKIALYSFS